jgi:hypothetical protein
MKKYPPQKRQRLAAGLLAEPQKPIKQDSAGRAVKAPEKTPAAAESTAKPTVA